MYEILPQDIKQRERKEIEKNDAFEAKNSLSLLQLKITSNGVFYIESMDYMDTTLSRIFPNMGEYLSLIYTQVGSYLSPNCY